MPFGAQAVRRIFDHRDTPRIAERHDRIHVAGVAAHVADQHRLCFVQLGREIGHIDAVILAHFYQNRHAVGMHDGRGHGGKGKGRDQHLGPAWQVQGFQRQEQGSRTGGHCQRVFRSHQIGEFLFQKRHRRAFGRGVAEEITRGEQPINLCARRFRDGFGVINIGGNGLTVSSHLKLS